MFKDRDQEEVYVSEEAAEIISVTDETVQKWCEKGKYPGAEMTETGVWKIPKKYFKILLEEARRREGLEKDLNNFNDRY